MHLGLLTNGKQKLCDSCAQLMHGAVQILYLNCMELLARLQLFEVGQVTKKFSE